MTGCVHNWRMKSSDGCVPALERERRGSCPQGDGWNRAAKGCQLRWQSKGKLCPQTVWNEGRWPRVPGSVREGILCPQAVWIRDIQYWEMSTQKEDINLLSHGLNESSSQVSNRRQLLMIKYAQKFCWFSDGELPGVRWKGCSYPEANGMLLGCWFCQAISFWRVNR